MSPNGKTDLVKLMLAQNEREHTSYGEDYKDLAYASRNFLAVTKTQGFVPEDSRVPGKVYFYNPQIEVTFSAGTESPYAAEMMDIINKIDFLSSQSMANIEGVLRLKNYVGLPKPTDVELTAAQAFFYDLDKASMEQFMSLAERGIPADQINFVAVLGPERGALAIEIYSQGLDAMKEIYAMNEMAFAAIYEGAPENIKKLLETNSDILLSFRNGGIKEETINYYVEQLKKLPKAAKHQDAL